MSFLESIYIYLPSIMVFLLACFLTLLLYRFYCVYSKKRENRSSFLKKGMLLFSSLLPVSLLAALRGIGVGADTRNLWNGYLECLTRPFVQQITMDFSEFLYDLFRWLVCRITNGNVQVFFFLMAFLTLLFVSFAINKWNTNYKPLALFIFLMLFGPNLMNQSRQLLSVAIMFFAFSCLYKSEYKRFILWSVAAVLIHLSAIVSAILYLTVFLLCKNNRSNFLFLFVLIITSLLSRYLVSLLGNLVVFEKYAKYFDSSESFNIGFGLLLVLTPTVIPTVLSRKEINDSRIRDTIYLTAPTRLIGYYSYFLYRITYFFSGIAMFAFPTALDRARGIRFVVLKVAFVFLPFLYFLLLYCWKDVQIYMPYYTFWQNGF